MPYNTIARTVDLDAQVLATDAGRTLLRLECQLILDHALAACRSGVNDFVRGAFVQAINELRSSDQTTYLIQLLGNTIWASAVFAPLLLAAGPSAALAGATLNFAISMTGIYINMSPNLPRSSQEANYVDTIAETAEEYFEAVHRHMSQNLPQAVSTYVDSNRQATFRDAKEAFLRSNLHPPLINFEGNPDVNQTALRRAVSGHATRLLRNYRRQIAPIGLHGRAGGQYAQTTWRNQVVWIRYPGQGRRLALIRCERYSSVTSGVTLGATYSPGHRDHFVEFVAPELEQLATQRQQQQTGRAVSEVDAGSIRNVPPWQ
jgi:hypothetical protein